MVKERTDPLSFLNKVHTLVSKNTYITIYEQYSSHDTNLFMQQNYVHFSLLSKIQMFFLVISNYTIYTYIIVIYSQVNIIHGRYMLYNDGSMKQNLWGSIQK